MKARKAVLEYIYIMLAGGYAMQKKLSPQQICSLAAGALFAVLSVVWLVRIFRVLVPMLELVGLIPEMFNGIQYFFLMFAAPLLAAVAMCLRKPALARAAFIAVAASLLINLVNGAINRSIAVLGYPASLALIAGYVLMAIAARAPKGRPNLVLSFLPAALVLLGRVLYLVPFTGLDLGYLLSYLDEIAALALSGFAFTETAARPYAAPGGFGAAERLRTAPRLCAARRSAEFCAGRGPGRARPAARGLLRHGQARPAASLHLPHLVLHLDLRTTKHLNALRDEPPRNPTTKLLLCMFVPFYAVYWAYKSGQRADRLAAQRGIPSNISAACLVCAIFIPFVMAIILQNKINAIAAPGPYAAPGGFAPPPPRQNSGAQGFTPYPGPQGFRPVPPQAPAGKPGPSGAPAQPPRAYAPVQTAARPAPAAQGFRPAPPERPQPQAGRPPRPAEPARAVPPEGAAPAPRRPQPAAPRAPKSPAGRAPAQAAPSRPQAAPPASGSPLAGLSEEALTELRAYKELYDIGIVTRAELEAKARELMGK